MTRSSGGLDWDKINREYQERRLREGSTPEQLAKEARIWHKPEKPKKKAEPKKSPGPKKNGPAKGSKRQGGIQMDPVMKLRFKELHDQGYDTKQISVWTGKPRDMIIRYLRSMGIEPLMAQGGNPGGNNQHGKHKRDRPLQVFLGSRQEFVDFCAMKNLPTFGEDAPVHYNSRGVLNGYRGPVEITHMPWTPDFLIAEALDEALDVRSKTKWGD